MIAGFADELAEARALDAADPLADARELFQIPDDLIYLDGNSLGPMPRATPAVIGDVVSQQWGTDLIRSWNEHDWIGAPQRVGARIASLIGAAAEEVIVADSVSVNLFKLLTAIARNRGDRTTIVAETAGFPTDAHVAAGVTEAMDLQLDLVPREAVVERLDRSVCALLLSHVHYRTGERFDMRAVNEAAGALGVPVVWDLSHSTGAVPLDLKRAGTQYAVGCGYKYLNGGPGAPAFLFVADDRQADLNSPLRGWLGHADPFSFRDDWEPARGMDRLLVGTPPILSLLALECGIRVFERFEMTDVQAKSERLFAFFARLMERHCEELRLITPTDPVERGSHASFEHPAAWPLNNALISRGVIGDYRTPDVLRFGLTPLYTRFEDLVQAVRVLAEILTTEEWRKPEYSQPKRVT